MHIVIVHHAPKDRFPVRLTYSLTIRSKMKKKMFSVLPSYFTPYPKILLCKNGISFLNSKISSEYNQGIPQSQTADKPVAL